MAETKKATYKRYNGTDWDTIYFATSYDQIGLPVDSDGNATATWASTLDTAKKLKDGALITTFDADNIRYGGATLTCVTQGSTLEQAIASLDAGVDAAKKAIPSGVLTTANYATTLDSVYEKKSDATSAHNTLTNKIDNLTTAVNNRYTKTESDNKYQPKGTYATLGTDGKVPATQLPSYVDDVIEGYYSNGKFYSDSAKTKEITGEGGKIYTDLTSNKTYRWGGTAWVEISASLAIGETAGTAYDGKKGHDTNLLASQAMEKASAHDNTLIELEQNKADKATTLAGYGITDAYTKTEADGKYVPYAGATKDVNLGKHSLFISNKSGYTDNPTIKLSAKGVAEDDIYTIIEPNKITIGNPGGLVSSLTAGLLEFGGAYDTGTIDQYGFKASSQSGPGVEQYSKYEYDGIDSNGNKLTFPEKAGTIALLSDIPNTYTKTESDGKYQPKGNYASTADLSNRATKIYFEDTVPTSGMVAGDICIEY